MIRPVAMGFIKHKPCPKRRECQACVFDGAGMGCEGARFESETESVLAPLKVSSSFPNRDPSMSKLFRNVLEFWRHRALIRGQ
eukprot:3692975-Rhodomonas_salina.2